MEYFIAKLFSVIGLSVSTVADLKCYIFFFRLIQVVGAYICVIFVI